ncbi:MAG: SusD/RagB family nutrient-binding outer membrane lipoprotein [Bacteroidota bacterium]
MKKIKIYTGLIMIVAAITMNSCKKDFLDVNTDPNNPTDVTSELILPPAIAHTAFITGGTYQVVTGFWAQYWTQGSTGNQYNIYDQYQIPNTTFDRQWVELYSDVLEDFKVLSEKGISEDKSNYTAIAYIMEAYVFQVLTDLHGDIPFSEALKGLENIAPHFDSQQSIYDGLITMIDKGISNIDYDASAFLPGADDFVYHGDMELWERFANSLKLRIYMRQSEVRPAVAQAGISNLYSNGAIFLEDGMDGEMHFVNSVGYEHPIYTEFINLSRANIMASNTILNYMIANSDPRIDAFFIPATTGPNAGSHAGIDQGDGKTPTFPSDATQNDFSQPSDLVAGGDAPAVFISASETYFLLSEAAARGWIADDAQALYEAGITSSFLRWGFTGTDASDYYTLPQIAFPASGTQEDKVKAIITEKWVANCGNQSIEGWNEWRRTGYPDFFTVSLTSLIAPGSFPLRLPYPNSEIQTNPNTPPQPDITAKVWWDIN